MSERVSELHESRHTCKMNVELTFENVHPGLFVVASTSTSLFAPSSSFAMPSICTCDSFICVT